MSELPSEILNIVYKHSSNKDVLQCALTCKKWKESALTHYYNSLSINANRIFQTKKLLQLDPSERDRYFQYGTFAKNLVVHKDYMRKRPFDSKSTVVDYTEEEWIWLLEYLPNIQVLDLSGSLNAIKYMKYILSCTDSDKILPQIKVFIKPDRQRTLADTLHCDDMHFAVCYKYRATITTLEVNFNSESFNSVPIHGDVVTMLYHFNSLTHLTFNNSFDDQLTTFDIMEACPYLVSLNYQSGHCFPEPIVKNILGSAMNRKRLNHNLKELYLTVPTISTHYADYLKDFVAPYLDVLKLEICDTDVFDWVERFGLYNAVGFLGSLSKVKTASIGWTPGMIYNRQTTSTKSEPTIFFTLLNAMTRNKKMHYQATYTDYQSTHKSFSLTPYDYLYFNYGLKKSDYYLPLTNQNFEQEDSLTRRLRFAIPNRSTSIIGPEVIHHFNVSMNDTHPNLPLEILRYALVNCPNLQRFWYNSINDDNDILLYVNPKKGNDIVKSIPNSINATKAQINVIKTNSIVPSKEMMCLFHQYLPAVEKLICLLDGLTLPPAEMFEMDLTAFMYLKSVRLDVQLFGADDQNTAFLVIQFSDKDWEYYHLWGDDMDLTVTKTTLAQMTDRISNKEYGDVRKAVIQCRKQVIFELSYGYSMVTEIHNGIIFNSRLRR
ncbi:hypothetical protein INT47_005042 [Mucor saturninus]|uniref:F-box domain-containing protein n=1 Tax=Mucor saturninus TaxID=64648 RepID=A0A8H7UPI8_9FUNG|nr:hypothetical protein INT47_005042 [Mucor saturninus]